MRQWRIGATVGLIVLGGLAAPTFMARTFHRPAVAPTIQSFPVPATRHSPEQVSWQGVNRSVAAPTSSAETTRPYASLTRTKVKPFGLVALTWKGGGHGLWAEIRVHEPGGWLNWQRVEQISDTPDVSSQEARMMAGRTGTDPMLTSGESDGVQIRVHARHAAKNLRLILIDGNRTDADVAALQQPNSVSAAYADPARPTIIPRSGWGADESLRSGTTKYSSTIKIGFVHHTVTASTYTREQAPAQVRAVYAYDTLGLGISDMGYNYLVDRFGNIYEGRAGGVEKVVIGAHTAGFNENSFAVAVLGDYHHDRPGSATLSAVVTAVGTVAGWKLGLFHRDPMAPVKLVSTGRYGTSKYDAGQTAYMPFSLIGHGDIGLTACPGKYLKAQLGLIRDIAREYQGPAIWSPSLTRASWAWQADAAAPTTTVKATTSVAMSITAQIFSPCRPEPIRTLVVKQTSAGQFTFDWDGRDDVGSVVAPGRYTIVMSGVTASGAVPWPTSDVVDIDPTLTSPLGPCTHVWRDSAVGTAIDAVTELNANIPLTTRTIVIASSEPSEIVNATVAANVAKRLKALFVVSATTGFSVATDRLLRDRTITKAIVVASSSRVASLSAALPAYGIVTVETISGASSREVSFAASKYGWKQPTSAVVIPSDASAGVVAAAGSYAQIRGWPLLAMPLRATKPGNSMSPRASQTTTTAPAQPSSTALPSASNSASASASNSASTNTTASGTTSASTLPAIDWVGLGITGTVIVGQSAMLDVHVTSSLPKPLVINSTTSASVALALAKKFVAPTKILVTTDAASQAGYAMIAAMSGLPVILTGSAVTTGITNWIRGTASITDIVLLGPRRVLTPVVVPAFVDALTPDTEPSPSGSGSVSASPSTSSSQAAGKVPSAFALSGSGFGHGIGMPQYGAQAQALAGRTAKEIVEYYYTGAHVKPVRDDATIRVNVLHQMPSITFRIRGVDATPDIPGNDPTAPVEITVGDKPVLYPAGDTFTLQKSTSGTSFSFQRTDAQGRTTRIGTYPTLTLKWGGTRNPGAAGKDAAYIDVAGPTEGMGDGYGRYRYGTMSISAVGYTSAGKSAVGLEVVNELRIHDEYLRGIGEVPASWSPAALQSQVIASRGFALSAVRGRIRAGCDCNVYDSDSSQVFAGWMREVGFSSRNAVNAPGRTIVTAASSSSTSRALTAASGSVSAKPSSTAPSSTPTKPSSSASPSSSGSASSSVSPSASSSGSGSVSPSITPAPTQTTELPLPANSLGRKWVQAVLATSPTLSTGLAATVDNKVIASYFYSASGGRTENSEEIWTARLSWARSVNDPWSLQANVVPDRIRAWQAVLTQQQMSSFFGLKSIIDIKVVDRTTGGAVRTLNATALNGATATQSAVTLRKQFDLRSRWIKTIAPYGPMIDVPTTSPTATPTTSPTSPSPSNSASNSGSASASSSSSPTGSQSPTPSVSPSAPVVSVTVDRLVGVVAGDTTSISGVVKNAPKSARVQLWQERKNSWRSLGSPVSIRAGRWALSIRPTAGNTSYRVQVLKKSGQVISTSAVFVIRAANSTPRIRVASLPRVTRGTAFVLSGTATAVPSGATLSRELRVGNSWQLRGAAVTANSRGKWQMQINAPRKSGDLSYRIVMRDRVRKVIASSKTFTIRVR